MIYINPYILFLLYAVQELWVYKKFQFLNDLDYLYKRCDAGQKSVTQICILNLR